MGKIIERNAGIGVRTLVEIAKDKSLNTAKGQAGARVVAAAKLCEMGGLLGSASAKSLELTTTKKPGSDDGKMEIVVRYEEAKPPEPDDAG